VFVRERSAAPIIMLTALEAVDERIPGLESGADDYVTKPFPLRQLQLRVAARLRRTEAAASQNSVRGWVILGGPGAPPGWVPGGGGGAVGAGI
jgi:DNA-binding response OmpR family regulator